MKAKQRVPALRGALPADLPANKAYCDRFSLRHAPLRRKITLKAPGIWAMSAKHLSFELFRIEAERLGLSLGKFVIPNPFGPGEEMRFTSYLAKEWAAGRTPTVATPVYIRDNIHVSLLALAYRCLCESLPQGPGFTRSAPSGYVESQGAFAHRVGREIGARTGRSCAIAEADQKDFPEPIFRTNAQAHPEWSEPAAWDALTEYYQSAFQL